MPKYTLDDIKVLGPGDALRAIRIRAWMYSRNPRKPLENIIAGIIDEFDRLGVLEHRFSETTDFFLIEAKQDWLAAEKPKASIEEHFNNIISPVTQANGVRSEVFLRAFYFPFYTNGPVGELGEHSLLDGLSEREIKNYVGREGRVLIISKKQNLPENHGIIFEPKPPTPHEIENNKRWKSLVENSTKK